MHLREAEELGQMTLAELAEHVQDLCLEKKSQAQRVKLMDSALGQEELSRWRERLKTIMVRYSAIRIGDSDRDVVIDLASTQCYEKLIREEIAVLESAKKVADGLDRYHALCDSVIAMKGKQERIAR